MKLLYTLSSLSQSVFFLSLIGNVANAFPTVDSTQDVAPPAGHSGVDNLRIKQVLDVMQADLGTLDWRNTTTGGAILLVSNDEWAHYEELARISEDTRTPEEIAAEEAFYSRLDARNALMRRDGEVSGGIGGKRTWVDCHESGSWAQQSVLALFIDEACNAFVGYLNTKITQVFTAPTFINNAGSTAQYIFKWSYYGYEAVSKNQCSQLLDKLVQSYCRGSNSDTRGGYVSKYTSNVGSLLWGNEVVKAGADPNAHNCNC